MPCSLRQVTLHALSQRDNRIHISREPCCPCIIMDIMKAEARRCLLNGIHTSLNHRLVKSVVVFKALNCFLDLLTCLGIQAQSLCEMAYGLALIVLRLVQLA